MGSVNTNVNGVSFTITKQPDGSFTYSTESMPGASFGANNEAVAGHYGGPLTADSVRNSIQSLQDNLISSKQSYIDDANRQLNSATIDPDYAAMLRNNVAKASADIEEFKSQVGVLIAIEGQVGSLQSQATAADAAGENPEAKTGAQANADAAQGATGATGASSTQEDPTNNNAGQKDYSDNGSNNPPGTGFGDDQEEFTKDSLGNTFKNGQLYRAAEVEDFPSQENSSRVTPSTISSKAAPAQASWKEAADLRAILRVPPKYITSFTDPSGQLSQFGGIVFPYTPQIGFSESATYNAINPLHSNYTIYTYKNSSVGSISLNAKFTVQNEKDGIVLLGVIHLLRALTKMKFGPDADAGAPPPVCRLNAYGTFMFKNIPVTVADFRHDLPEGVDYIAVGRSSSTFGPNLLPVLSTITLTLNPTYSRSEMMAAGVDTWLSGGFAGKGYL